MLQEKFARQVKVHILTYTYFINFDGKGGGVVIVAPKLYKVKDYKWKKCKYQKNL